MIDFVVAGEIILRALNIPVEAFRIAGGLILWRRQCHSTSWTGAWT